jgi:hypothetical protein
MQPFSDTNSTPVSGVKRSSHEKEGEGEERKEEEEEKKKIALIKESERKMIKPSFKPMAI